MSAITVRKLPDDVKHRLRVRAAENGRSMEAEAREILVVALAPGADQVGLGWVERLIALGEEFDGVDVPVPPRAAPYVPPRFDPS